jgi:hypothetical protein
MVLDIQTVHHILKNTAVQNVNKPFVYITDVTSTLIWFGKQIEKSKFLCNVSKANKLLSACGCLIEFK